MNVAGKLFSSRRFWFMVVNVVVSVTTYFVAKYTNPEISKDVLFLLGLLQPVVITVIVAYTYDDTQEAKLEQALALAKIDKEIEVAAGESAVKVAEIQTRHRNCLHEKLSVTLIFY